MNKTVPTSAVDSITKQRITRLALVWLLFVLAVSGHNLWLWGGHHLPIDTDVLAMLPQDERDTAVQSATRQLADSASRRIVVLIGGRDWNAAIKASDVYAASLAKSKLALNVRYRVGEAATQQWIDFYAPYRQQLLTDTQRTMLTKTAPEALARSAIEALYRPMSMPRIGSWSDDPLNLFGTWLTTRASDSKVRMTDGRLSLTSGDHHYSLLIVEQQGSAFSINEQQTLMPVLAKAKASALATFVAGDQNQTLDIYTVGIPLYAAAAAAQAENEVHTIGIGSLIGIVVLTLCAFSAIRPRILVTLSIAIGLLTAISVCALVFGRLHLITLVFGASLVGVAENYGTNYFSARLGRPVSERWQILREQAPTMWLAMLTTVIGYALLALAPFPGLRQMAVFSAVGLLAAFFTSIWWFPLLDGGRMESTRFALWLGGRRALWPTIGRNRFTVLATVAIVTIIVSGACLLRANDDIRSLQNSPPALIVDQIAVNRLLDLPGAAQFYLVRGASVEQVLQREQTLKAQLRPLIASHSIGGYQAISDWLPSISQQAADAALLRQAVFSEYGAFALAASQLNEPLTLPASVPTKWMDMQTWLASPVSEPLRYQWLGQFEGGYASVMLVRGIDHNEQLVQLAEIATRVDGVRWVDKVAEISFVMRHYRQIMGGVIVLAYMLVFAALSMRFGRTAWRALLPTALASMLSLAVLALCGQPLQLFNVLALLLILGMGVDYGIFLLAQPSKAATRPFLSITLAAVSTLLSFGLLALSSTPALRAFGLTMLLGIGLSWLLTPTFMSDLQEKKSHAK